MQKKILFICTAQPDYPRNTQILKALSSRFQVIKIVSRRPFYPLRILEVIIRFLLFSPGKDYHLIYAGFLGQPLVTLLKFFKKKPLVLDAFVSVYDCLCLDRKDFKTASLAGKISYRLDKLSFYLADTIITDTNANAEFFSALFKIGREKFYTLYMGADENIFYPKEVKRKGGHFIVFFHGTFWPLHGIEYIIKAAKLLEKEKDIVVRLLGAGREKEKILRLAKNLEIRNVEFINWVSYEDLSNQIAEADLCLGGHFSTAQKAKRVIAGKTFMYLAMKKPVIAGDNPANREVFIHAKNIYMCEMGNALSLADAILKLKENADLKDTVAQAGFDLFKELFSNKKTQERLSKIIADKIE
ncbi:MAG: hypothetical protein A3D27_03505 [Omnitrophica WOR_2 bacterium RIFCSPHIGHO2_02_FULL_46_37]|nr:MAG: hypothetical protein A3D27_03505 [Omnitrophica WOR_2 bacterium RIFCSPHIGHO2_02_FULL_46_37]